MYIKKITGLRITCPHCGSETSMTWSEFDKYRKEMEDYAGATITCQRKGEDGKNRDIEYTNFNCPACGGYVPTVVSDGVESDVWGFVYSNCVKPSYGNYDEIKIEDYLNQTLGLDESEEGVCQA